jgi:hypothetical protein
MRLSCKYYWTHLLNYTKTIHRVSIPLLSVRWMPRIQFWTTRTRYWKNECWLRNGLRSLHRYLNLKYESAKAYGRKCYNDTKSIQDRTRRVLQHHARLGTSFDSIWIIDSLDPQHGRQLATTKDQLVMTFSDVDWSIDVVVRQDDPSLQFVIVKNVNSGLCNVITDVISSGEQSSPQSRYSVLNADDCKMSGIGLSCFLSEHRTRQRQWGYDRSIHRPCF